MKDVEALEAQQQREGGREGGRRKGM